MLGDIIGRFKDNPFLQNKQTLLQDRERLVLILENTTGKKVYTELFLEAFNYFMEHPRDYDGATGDSENGAFKKYDIPAIVHDYLDVIGATYTFYLMRLSDGLFVRIMEDLSFYSVQIQKRKIALWLVARVRWWRLKKKYKKGLLIKNKSKWL